MVIPKVIFQTSKNKRPYPYIVKMIKNKAPEWEYIHFTDLEIIRFFVNNPLNEFSNIINKFKSIKNGSHKADLFRYYFLYIKGGVFIDDDAMIQYDMNNISVDYDFFQ
jgi:mannosyltransferase OCH1-like enzyme